MFVFPHFGFQCPQKPSAASQDHMKATVYNYQLGKKDFNSLLINEGPRWENSIWNASDMVKPQIESVQIP